MCAAGHLFLLCIDELWPTHPPGLFSCTLHMLVCLCSTVALSLLRFFVVWPLLLDCSVYWYLMVNALLAPGALPALLAPGALPAVGVLVALGSLGLEDL